MEQITVHSRARVPAITFDGGVSRSRLDKHLAVLAGPAVPRQQTDEATTLMRAITPREERTARADQGAGLSLFAPLRRLRRSLFGGKYGVGKHGTGKHGTGKHGTGRYGSC